MEIDRVRVYKGEQLIMIKRLYFYSVAVFVFLQHVKKYYLHLLRASVCLMY